MTIRAGAYDDADSTIEETDNNQTPTGLVYTPIVNSKEPTWIKTYWRPAMGWLYMLICFMDFVGFPFLAGIQPIVYKALQIEYTYQPWTSLTLENGGLVHIAFGAILGVAAWTRGQEKLEDLKRR